MGEAEDKPYLYPLGMPVTGKMGSYGCIYDVSEDGTWHHVYPYLWSEIAYIWTKAMFGNKYESLNTELQGVRSKLEHDLEKPGYTDESREAHIDFVVYHASDKDWARRLKNILLFAPDFGNGHPLFMKVREWITQPEPPAVEEVNKLEQLIAVFMSSCITGMSLCGRDETHPFEQYPTLEFDYLWHKAMLKQVQMTMDELRAKQEED